METATLHKSRFSHLVPGWLVLFTLAHLNHHLLTALSGPLLPFIRSDFDLDYARSGLVLSVFSITYGLSQLPGGWLADKLGGRGLITLGIVGVALTGIAIYFSRSYIWLLVLLGFMGFIGGGYHPAAPPLVCATAAPGRRGLALGVHAIGGSVAFFIAPLFVAATAGKWGWRISYLGMAIPTLIFGVILYIVLGQFRHGTSTMASSARHAGSNGMGGRQFIWFVAMSALGTVALGIVVAYLPLILVDRFKVNEGNAAALLAVIYLTGIFANMAVGFLTDNFSRRGILAGSLLIAALAAGALSHSIFLWEVICLLVVFGLLIVVLQNVAESFIMTNVTRQRASSVLGTYYFTTMAGSGLFTPVVGALIDRQGFSISFGILAAVMAVTGAAYWLLKNR